MNLLQIGFERKKTVYKTKTFSVLTKTIVKNNNCLCEMCAHSWLLNNIWSFLSEFSGTNILTNLIENLEIKLIY
jgi:hypothetical protein